MHSISCFSQEVALVPADPMAGEADPRQDPCPAHCQLVSVEPEAEDWVEDEEVEDDVGEGDKDDDLPNRGGASKRKHVTVYQKILAIREVDRLIEAGEQHGIEKKVMQLFPDVFMGVTGSFKSGMLGRWIAQADQQGWRKIPWEKMSAADRDRIKELPDWVRVPMGMLPRSLDRFKAGFNVPSCIVTAMVRTIERVTCGGATANLTAGNLTAKSAQKECQRMLDEYAEAQIKACEEKGLEPPKHKLEVSLKWIYRLLDMYGWKRNTPNTAGAYLDYEDERMERSRKSWKFLRLAPYIFPCPSRGFLHVYN